MSRLVGIRPDLNRRAIDRLRRWPTVRVAEGPGVTSVGPDAEGPQVLYLFGDDHAELNLTWPVTLRMGEALTGCAGVSVSAGDDWIRLRLDAAGDVELLLALLSVALQAHAPTAK